MKRYLKAAIANIQDEPNSIRRSIAQKETDPFVLGYFSDETDPEVIENLLENSNTPIEVVRAISNANPDFECGVSLDFWVMADIDFPISTLVDELDNALEHSNYAEEYKFSTCTRNEKYCNVKMNNGCIVNYYDLDSHFYLVADFWNARDEIHHILGEVVERLGGHPHVYSFDYKF